MVVLLTPAGYSGQLVLDGDWGLAEEYQARTQLSVTIVYVISWQSLVHSRLRDASGCALTRKVVLLHQFILYVHDLL
jgi:hypothetical protein